MFYIYFIYSSSADKFYVGYSNDPKNRLVKHNSTISKTFTKKFRPWILVYYFPVSDSRADAMKIERYIKKQKSRKLILKIINERLGMKEFEWVLKK